jgi:tRNA pseudouridine55 synthase
MMDGFLNILKPPGMSSHDVIGAVRKVLHMKRVGHAGTLDPAAAGVLPIAVGQAARLIEYLELADKTYRAELTFGFATDSGDDTGKITEEVADFTMPSQQAIEHALLGFTGKIRQTPPAHSAIKIGGKRACDLLREGKEVEIPSREVTIHALDLVAYHPEEKKILLDVQCSKGTYIRSLCLDIGAALGLPATMSFLVRSRVGDFALADALTLEELSEAGERAILEPLITLLAPFAPHIAEELWHQLGHDTTICDARWPKHNEEYLKEKSVVYAISFNGKARYNLELPADISKEDAEKAKAMLRH